MTSTLRLIVRAAVIVFIIAVALFLIIRFTRNSPIEYTDNAIENFKYGSTGGEIFAGIPYAVWMTLPSLFNLPHGNYESFGFLYEAGKDLPIGVSKRNYRGIDLVSFNCAICHYGSVRKTPDAKPDFIPGMPSNTVDLRAFYQFVFDAAKNPKFTGGSVLAQAKIMNLPKEDFINRLLLRYYAVMLMRTTLIDFNDRLAFILKEPDFGPGRIDTFSPAKALLGFPTANMPDNERYGVTDFPSIWYQGKREGMQLHWDGNNTKVDERNRSAAFGTGAYPPTLDRGNMRRIHNWLANEAKPPKFYGPVASDLAARGKTIYDQLCANCHGPDGVNFAPGQGELGKVTPIDKIGTDPHRLDSYTLELAVNQNLLYAETKDPSERFSHFRKTWGYANMPLDGIWLRAPYLHNGSVPTLRDLLEPASNRPKSFYRGDDVYDPVRVGFESNVKSRGDRQFFYYDTSVTGNGNQGHEGRIYGTELSPADKDALVEYLKNF